MTEEVAEIFKIGSITHRWGDFSGVENLYQPAEKQNTCGVSGVFGPRYIYKN